MKNKKKCNFLLYSFGGGKTLNAFFSVSIDFQAYSLKTSVSCPQMSIFYHRFFSLSDKKKKKIIFNIFLEPNEERKISEKIKNNQKNKILVKNHFFFCIFFFFLEITSQNCVFVIFSFSHPKMKNSKNLAFFCHIFYKKIHFFSNMGAELKKNS